MRKLSCLFGLALLAAIAVATMPTPAQAGLEVQVNGGGTGLFVDPSVTPTDLGLFTNFAVGLTVHAGGSATGHFTCMVPGYVIVDGHYDSGSYDSGTGIVTASGTGMEVFPKGLTGDGDYLAIPISFTTTFKAGGPGVGVFTLTADDGYFVVPPYLDTELVIKGQITIK